MTRTSNNSSSSSRTSSRCNNHTWSAVVIAAAGVKKNSRINRRTKAVVIINVALIVIASVLELIVASGDLQFIHNDLCFSMKVSTIWRCNFSGLKPPERNEPPKRHPCHTTASPSLLVAPHMGQHLFQEDCGDELCLLLPCKHLPQMLHLSD